MKCFKCEHELRVINVFIREKFLRLTMGFGYFMYSHSLVPVIDLWISGRDKVGIRAMVSLLILNCRFVFSYTTAVLGCQMSVMSSLILVFCVVSVLLLCLVLFVLSSLNKKESTRCSCC